jgi:hypothetical protein
MAYTTNHTSRGLQHVQLCLLQEPIHSLAVRGFTLFFSSSSFFCAEVGHWATTLLTRHFNLLPPQVPALLAKRSG